MKGSVSRGGRPSPAILSEYRSAVARPLDTDCLERGAGDEPPRLHALAPDLVKAKCLN